MWWNSQEFIQNRHPNFHPIHDQYEFIDYWSSVKRKCIEGYWVGGKWMPPELYHHINLWKINLTKSGLQKSGGAQSFGSPDLRDLDWEKAHVYAAVYGFSGFELDTRFTCNIRFHPDVIKESLEFGYITLEQAEQFTYVNPIDYLQRDHGKPLGKALWQNPLMNLIDLEARGGGKSFWASDLIGHNFMFDGARDYDEYLLAKRAGNQLVSQTLVGAINVAFSSDLLTKFKNAFQEYPGKFIDSDITYPSPLTFETRGTLESGDKPFVSLKSGSQIHHRVFAQKHTAGNGTRPNRVFIEEAGFMHNIVDVHGALLDVVKVGDIEQFGSIVYFGTGGDIKNNTGAGFKKMFYNPHEYNAYPFEDTYEGRGSIGYFVEIQKVLNAARKGPNHILDRDLADRMVAKERAAVKNNPRLWLSLLQNRPEKPSEAFIDSTSNKFPIEYLKMAEENLNAPNAMDGYWIGFFRADKTLGTKFVNVDKIPNRFFPPEKETCYETPMEVYELPREDHMGNVFSYRYIASLDPVDDDDLDGSLQSFHVMDWWTGKIVLDYTTRTRDVTVFYENVRLALIAYNAVCNYENSKKGFYAHMKLKNSLHLLAKTPEIIYDKDLATTRGEGNKAYGTPATTGILSWGENLLVTYLLSQVPGEMDGINQAMSLKSQGIVLELQSYGEGNFDRVSSLKMLMILKAEYDFRFGNNEEEDFTDDKGEYDFAAEFDKFANFKDSIALNEYQIHAPEETTESTTIWHEMYGPQDKTQFPNS